MGGGPSSPGSLGWVLGLSPPLTPHTSPGCLLCPHSKHTASVPFLASPRARAPGPFSLLNPILHLSSRPLTPESQTSPQSFSPKPAPLWFPVLVRPHQPRPQVRALGPPCPHPSLRPWTLLWPLLLGTVGICHTAVKKALTGRPTTHPLH